MKRIEKLTAVLILIMGLATSCKKEEKAAPPTDDTISILQSGDWEITAFTITSASNDLTDVMLNMPPCAKDNLLQFKNNGVFILMKVSQNAILPEGKQKQVPGVMMQLLNSSSSHRPLLILL